MHYVRAEVSCPSQCPPLTLHLPSLCTPPTGTMTILSRALVNVHPAERCHIKFDSPNGSPTPYESFRAVLYRYFARSWQNVFGLNRVWDLLSYACDVCV